MTTVDVARLVDDLTLEEQVSLLAGANFWQTVAIERLGIPAIKVTDGPNGARGAGAFSSGVPAASFPVGISLASTWDVTLVGEIAQALAEEAKTKGSQVLLAPTVNLHRSPLGGRNFESFSEDPWLAGVLGAAFVTALQGEGIAATVKHFTGNESEFERMTIDSHIPERALRELYLRPFEIVVRQAKPWAVMAAYNKLNGTYACDNRRLLTEILRDEWGFDGLVMSDWTGTRSTAAAVNAGLDLEMPGPTKLRGDKLVAAARSGETSRTAIAASATRVLALVDRVGGFENPDAPVEHAVDDPRHRALIREAGAKGTVLLANKNLLPLEPDRIKRIAVVGPNAAVAQIMGGGSSQINAHYRISPVEGIRAAVGRDVEVLSAPGCSNNRLLSPVTGPVQLEFFPSDSFAGDPISTQSREHTDVMWLGYVAPGVDFTDFGVRMYVDFEVDRSAEYEVGVVSSGPVRVFIDDQLAVEGWDTWQAGGEYFGLASAEIRGSVALDQGVTHRLLVESRTPENGAHAGLKALRLGIERESDDEALERAVHLAASADVAVVCVGLSGEWDTEGMDRPHMDLPGRQDELVTRIAAANPNTVVVLQSGGAVTMPWVDEVGAIVQAWYPGQECGNAIADVLFGVVNPSGRLPQTFPRLLGQNPAALTYPGERGVAQYGEGIFAGYRYYEKTQTVPLFPFGHGLSYTAFAYGNVNPSCVELAPGDSMTISIDITNVGARDGAEVVQLYVADRESQLFRPVKELKGFARVELRAGETGTVQFHLDMRSLAYFDDVRGAWVADAGQFDILIGSSSVDIRSSTTVTLTGEWVESARDAWQSSHN